MKWTNKPYPKHGDIRYKVFFAWLPITIGLETRWLEIVSVKQEWFSRIHERVHAECMSHWQTIAFEQQPLPDFKYNTASLTDESTYIPMRDTSGKG